MIRVLESGFTEGKMLFRKSIGDVEHVAEYYPAGFNQVRAVFHKSKAGLFRYTLCLHYCNPDVDKDTMLLHLFKLCVDKQFDTNINYVKYCVDQAWDIKDPDIVETKKIRFINYAFFLSRNDKSAWVREIKASLIKRDVYEFYNEVGTSVSAKDCAEALGIHAKTASKYKKEYKKEQ